MLFSSFRAVRARVELDRSRVDAYALCRAAVDRALVQRNPWSAELDDDPDCRLLRIALTPTQSLAALPLSLAIVLDGDGPVQVEISSPPDWSEVTRTGSPRAAAVRDLARFLVDHNDARLLSEP